LLRLLYETHKYDLTTNFRIINVQLGGTYTRIYGVVLTSQF